MRKFDMMEIDEAYEYSNSGGQSLHLHNIIVDERRSPRCFVNAIRRGEQIAHLFDQDINRLILTARRLGVKVICVENGGTSRQHIDLCSGPLRRALAYCVTATFSQEEYLL